MTTTGLACAVPETSRRRQQLFRHLQACRDREAKADGLRYNLDFVVDEAAQLRMRNATLDHESTQTKGHVSQAAWSDDEQDRELPGEPMREGTSDTLAAGKKPGSQAPISPRAPSSGDGAALRCACAARMKADVKPSPGRSSNWLSKMAAIRQRYEVYSHTSNILLWTLPERANRAIGSHQR